VAKHRLFYTLIKFNLPLETRGDDGDRGLAFYFLADADNTRTPKVITGKGVRVMPPPASFGAALAAASQAGNCDRGINIFSSATPATPVGWL
jgi:hypothetical protein